MSAPKRSAGNPLPNVENVDGFPTGMMREAFEGGA
jgi:hypothetical protein